MPFLQIRCTVTPSLHPHAHAFPALIACKPPQRRCTLSRAEAQRETERHRETQRDRERDRDLMPCSIIATAVEHLLKLLQIYAPVAIFVHFPDHLLHLGNSVLINLCSDSERTWAGRRCSAWLGRGVERSAKVRSAGGYASGCAFSLTLTGS